jgi:tetratricopeptide (TPR) repeat protein
VTLGAREVLAEISVPLTVPRVCESASNWSASPDSGVGYQQSWGTSGARRSAPVPVAPLAPPKPGLMASGYEKAFRKAVNAYADGDAQRAAALFREAAEKDTKDKALADDLCAGVLSAQVGDDNAAVQHLEKVVASEQAVPDQLMEKYVPGGGISIAVTENVAVEVPFGSLAAALTLAEVYQRGGRLDEAIGVSQQLVEMDLHPFLVLSLCDLYAEARA